MVGDAWWLFMVVAATDMALLPLSLSSHLPWVARGPAAFGLSGQEACTSRLVVIAVPGKHVVIVRRAGLCGNKGGPERDSRERKST